MHDVTLPGRWSVHLAHRDLVYVVTLMGDPEGPVVGHGPDILNACEAVVRTAQHRGQNPPDAQAIHDAFHGPPTADPRRRDLESSYAVSERMDATVNLALKVEAGTLSPAAARLALAAGGYGPEVVARIDALEVPPPRTPEYDAGIQMGVDCVQRLVDEAGPGETVAEVLDRLLAVSDRSRLEHSGQGPGPGRRQALVVTYSDSLDGPLSMFVDLEGEDGAALDPLTFTDAGRSLVVGLEAIATPTEEAS